MWNIIFLKFQFYNLIILGIEFDVGERTSLKNIGDIVRKFSSLKSAIEIFLVDILNREKVEAISIWFFKDNSI